MQKLTSALVGETLGTFLLVLFGTGSVACATAIEHRYAMHMEAPLNA